MEGPPTERPGLSLVSAGPDIGTAHLPTSPPGQPDTAFKERVGANRLRGAPKRVLLGVLQVAVTALALWLVLRPYDIATLLQLVSRASAIWLLAGAVLVILQLLILAWRWEILIRIMAGRQAALWPLVACMGRSILLGQILPASIGADAIRIGTLSRQTGIVIAVRTVFGDRLIGLLTLVIMVVVMLPVFGARTNSDVAFVSLAFASLGALIVFPLIAIYPHLFEYIPFFGHFSSIIATDLRMMFLGGRRGHMVLALSLLTHVMSVFVFAAFAQAVNSGILLSDSFLIIPIVQLITGLPISLGGWGMREGIIATSFSMIGADPVTGIAASILFGLTNPLLGLGTELLAFVVRPGAPLPPHERP
jgi:uncharacterized membrane protein YbhN (UPF0104 family)